MISHPGVKSLPIPGTAAQEVSGYAGTVGHLEIQHNTALQRHTPISGWGWVEMGRRGGLGSRALSQLALSLSSDFLGPLEAAAPIAPPSWRLEVPNGDHSDSGRCSFYRGGVSPHHQASVISAPQAQPCPWSFLPWQ